MRSRWLSRPDAPVKEINIPRLVFLSLLMLMIGLHFFPERLPYPNIWDPWRVRGSVRDWFSIAGPLMLWGVGIKWLVMTRIHRLGVRVPPQVRPRDILMVGAIISLRAAVFEEILFRWVIFFGMVGWAIIANFILLGFAGFGLPELMYDYVLCPVMNFITLGTLHEWLYHPAGWAVGASLLSTTIAFRDCHAYQGRLGWLNSWFLGLVFFKVALSYGLLPAMLVHLCYNGVVFICAALFHKTH